MVDTELHVEKSFEKLAKEKNPKIFNSKSAHAAVGTPPLSRRNEPVKAIIETDRKGYEDSIGGQIAETSLGRCR